MQGLSTRAAISTGDKINCLFMIRNRLKAMRFQREAFAAVV